MPRLAHLVAAVPFSLPLRAPFRGLTARDGVLLRGPAGWGEFSPFADYDVDRDARWLASALAAASMPPPVPVRDFVPVNAILPEVAAGEVAAYVAAAVTEQGCRTVKCKVGRADPGEDVALVAGVRESLDELVGPGAGRIRVDANGRWPAATAAQVLAQLRPHGIEYVEQPCRTVGELRRLRDLAVGVPVAVDESIRVDRDWVDVPEFADVAVLKVSPLGGPDAVLGLASQVGVPVVISGALESSIGLAQDVAVAAALPELPYACGLGTGSLLADDVLADPLVPRSGVIPLGAGVPDDAALQRAAARMSPSRRGDWLERLESAFRRALELELVPAAHLDALGAA